MEEKKDISEIFLNVFVKELIRNKALQSRAVFEKDVKKVKEKIIMYRSESDIANDLINSEIEKENSKKDTGVVEESFRGDMLNSIAEKEIRNDKSVNLPIPSNMTIEKAKKPVVAPLPIRRTSPQMIRRPVNQFPIRPPMMIQKRRLAPQLQTSKEQTPAKKMEGIEEFVPSITEQKTDIGLPKIDNILKDPKVLTVECPGPNKPVLIYRAGSIQTSNIILTGDEVNNVMKTFSEKTRIPIMSGVFKAAIGNLIVTAVMSDFVGTRFIIQKKPSIANATQ